MKLTRLKLTGFKSFVETTEFPIEPGLSGVVGPNGCGKSNLVEALRWVMGENSFKSMRASGMDDVIFSGSGARPARNMAEVALVLDNGARTAPAQFNDNELLEVTRRIEREEGSTYRVNGKEVRARDVQLLFADASTGSRSPALVRQGQISEIIAARPQARRRILEEAAGIAGLHSRRHEAELRLKAAEDNLLRLEDVLGEIDGQIESLRRQSRQAARYKALAAEIRASEALLAAIGYVDARDQAAAAGRAAEAALREVATATTVQAEAARREAVAAHALGPLREEEAKAAAALARLIRARDTLEAEERRNRDRAAELMRRIAELDADLARSEATAADAQASLERLEDEDKALVGLIGSAGDQQQDARQRAHEAQAALVSAEHEHADHQARAAELKARRTALERQAADAAGRAATLAAERQSLDAQLRKLDEDAGVAPLETLTASVQGAQAALAEADAAASAARHRLAVARTQEGEARIPLAAADRKAQRLETEARTLRKLLAGQGGALWPPVVDQISVQKGYETALGAALGDDLEVSANASSPTHWRDGGTGEGDPRLPGDAEPLVDKVRAPAVLQRRLRQIGVVARADGTRLMGQLAVGQRLVSREGDLWRWDGLVMAAEAPSPAARRLAEKNRLVDLERAAQAAQEAAETAREQLEAAQGAVQQAALAEAAANDAVRLARQRHEAAREALAQAERKLAQTQARRAALIEGAGRLASQQSDAERSSQDAHTALAALEPAAALDSALQAAAATLALRRAQAAEARVAAEALDREAKARQERAARVKAELAQWRERMGRIADARGEALRRREAAETEAKALADAPDTYLVRRRELFAAIDEADAARKAAADALASGETEHAAADRAAREALDGLAKLREARAGHEAKREAAAERLAQITRAIADNLDTAPEGLWALAGLPPGTPLPPAAQAERKLGDLKADRERLGAVNLRAEDELAEAASKREGLASERDDLTEAIRRLRQAIGALNREGRERLLAAFDVVNGHFKRLFGVLFGGGEAELTLVDSEDPLEAGLDILARPPGKKPQTMTLLSGGEQALTATALIFAVFLTNPSPICVLDEVDAPLDDANVERYCDLLRDMVRQTETRFLVITHNPITMARMDRLFGVTMAERGVSQLVSVDLETAERLREAG